MALHARNSIHVALVVLLLTAGCLGGAAVSETEARDRALAAEEAHISQQFENASCVEGWGLESYTGVEREATVLNQTAEGVYVEVTQPFWYSTAEVEADVGSEAEYFVSENATRRVAGTEISPC